MITKHFLTQTNFLPKNVNQFINQLMYLEFIYKVLGQTYSLIMGSGFFGGFEV